MGFLGFGKKRTLDFTNAKALPKLVRREYQMSGDFADLRDERKEIKPSKQISSASKSPFDFLTGSSGSYQSTSSTSSNPIGEVSEISELKTKLRVMTGKVEDQSNEIYRLMQRIELLERKLERFEGRS
ncbi:hypothetical protein COU56_04510 [Candidatus Pacearchaeota archaeon CG10_big_fil_rev_8_21_14_0_10_31_9]|nr:MAG: hypothetical protein AUJ62_00450 [Candidatus Pacearchaeota archaeon CG1_02_32_21]PIN91877.1 MAG: hypothetical protein COU56_04510 [Candidatus Pacearchaeota archaeon CG10_big_fil_rev_8_21_14_0_10_31_9]PIZ82773.1 MAG: hypothetical protein COX97_03080 [Candidatus Pacearchaeota archaeon CG_4_10_14_0_2_um_filter_05_32_18]